MAVVEAPDKTVAVLNKTVAKKGPPKKVLEEDEYVEVMIFSCFFAFYSRLREVVH